MSRRERIGQRAGNIDDLLDGKPAFGNQAIKRQAFHELHCQEVDALRFLDGIYGHNIRMV